MPWTSPSQQHPTPEPDPGEAPPKERPRMSREGLTILVDEGQDRLQEWDNIEAGGGRFPEGGRRRDRLREAVREGNARLGRDPGDGPPAEE